MYINQSWLPHKVRLMRNFNFRLRKLKHLHYFHSCKILAQSKKSQEVEATK